MMRSYNYARTPPEAPEGLPVFVVRFALVNMVRELMGRADRRQWLLARKIRPNEVEQSGVVTS
jgi:hypothetical protein